MLNLFLIKRWLFSSITPIGISLVKMELRVFEAINVKIVNIIWGLPRRKGSFVITVARDQLLDLYGDRGWGERSGEIFWAGLENCFFCNAGLSFYLWFYAKCTCKQHLPSSLLFISGKINDCHSEYKITSLPGVKSNLLLTTIPPAKTLICFCSGSPILGSKPSSSEPWRSQLIWLSKGSKGILILKVITELRSLNT